MWLLYIANLEKAGLLHLSVVIYFLVDDYKRPKKL